jgi:hypothetical protein
LQTVRGHDDVGVEESEVLEIAAELTETPVAAAGKTAVDLLDHQRDPGVIEAADELTALVL